MRKGYIIGSIAAGLMLVAGPALANGQSGSTEHHTECDEDPITHEPINCHEVYTNDVSCGDGDVVDTPTGQLVITGTGDPAAGAGELEVCSGNSDVLQGRVILGGSADQGGYVIADGDKDNDDQAQGFARLDVTGDGPAVSCGDSNGNKDGTEPTADDTQDDCGS